MHPDIIVYSAMVNVLCVHSLMMKVVNVLCVHGLMMKVANVLCVRSLMMKVVNVLCVYVLLLCTCSHSESGLSCVYMFS